MAELLSQDTNHTERQERLKIGQSVRFAAFDETLSPSTAPVSIPISSTSSYPSPHRATAIKSALKHSVSSSSAASGSTDSGFAGSAFADNDGKSSFSEISENLKNCMFLKSTGNAWWSRAERVRRGEYDRRSVN